MSTLFRLVNSIFAFVPDTALLHAVIRPASESKMKLAGADPASVRTTKSPEGLNTTPVGAPSGMLTTSGAICGIPPFTPPV